MSLSSLDEGKNYVSPYAIDKEQQKRNETLFQNEKAHKISTCISLNASKYIESFTEEFSLSLLGFIWNALYFSVRDAVRKEGIEHEVLKEFLDLSISFFNMKEKTNDAVEYLLFQHSAVMEELEKANINVNTKDGLLRGHQLTLILANSFDSYRGSLIPSKSQENQFLLAAATIQKEVREILSLKIFEPVQTYNRPPAEAKKATKSSSERFLFALAFLLIIFAVLILVAAFSSTEASEPTLATVSVVTQEQQLQEKPRPRNGEVLKGNGSGKSEIKITASTTDDHVVSLKAADGTLRLAFYVRAGQTTTVNAPEERLYVYFASGDKWYGYGKGLMFGEDTVYSKDDELLDFSAGGWEYTLHPVSNGNFSETPIDEGEFF